LVVGSPKSDLRRRLSTAVLLPLGILAIVGALMAMQVEQQAEDAAWLDRTDEILGKSSDVLGEIVDQETGLRGYLASGDELFLEPYRKANPGPLIDELRASVSGDPAQVARVDEIRRRYEFWKDSTGRTTNDLSEARKPAALREGKREMDDIRTTIREFRSAEFELR
jgi:CHASE3 domain sensor protein